LCIGSGIPPADGGQAGRQQKQQAAGGGGGSSSSSSSSSSRRSWQQQPNGSPALETQNLERPDKLKQLLVADAS
jgi:hypothetical protein